MPDYEPDTTPDYATEDPDKDVEGHITEADRPDYKPDYETKDPDADVEGHIFTTPDYTPDYTPGT